jgi:putative ABC transport system permease protein
MNSKKSQHPPRLAEWILAILHSDRGKHTHLGDFEEVYQTVCEEKGPKSAIFWYWVQVFRSLPGFLINRVYWSLSMFRNYFVIAVRNLIKNRWFSLINLLGLAAGLACVIMILSFIRFELSYERFHEKSDRIVRVLSVETANTARRGDFDSDSPEVLAAYMKDHIPEVVRASRLMAPHADKVILQNEEDNFYMGGLYADNEFLQMFSYPLLSGIPEDVLKAPRSIVLTNSTAKKLFGNENPIGETLIYKERSSQYEVTVTGVTADPRRNSHLQFDYLLSVQTLVVDESKSYMIGNWNVGNFITYAELRDADALAGAEKKLNAGVNEMAAAAGEDSVDLRFQPLRDIHLRSQIEGELATNNLIRSIYLFGSIALLILLIAGINHMNMATARSATRMREIGMRKVVGASRKQLITQFIGESMMVVLTALALAAVIVRFTLPRFSALLGVDLAVNYAKDIPLTLIVLGSALILGLLSGIYPALVLSSFPPTRNLRKLTASHGKNTWLRNGLVIFQFAASIILIACTLTVFRQLSYIKNHKLGFDREQVVVLQIREKGTRDKAAVIKDELLKRPEVLGVSVSGGLPINIRSRLYNARIEGESGDTERMTLRFDYIDEDFVEVYGIEIALGRNFAKNIETDKDGVLVNESLVRKLGWTRPLGKTIDFFDGEKKVLGVIKDFYHSTFHNAIEPIGLFFRTGDNISVRIRPGDIAGTLGVIRRVFERQTRSQPFDYYFLDDAFDTLYRKEQRIGGIFGLFAGLAVLIACLGLLSLAAFSVERRTREIGVRKVMGASVPRLVGHLTREYLWLVVAATVIAWPLSYYAMSRWLQNFAYRISLNPLIFILASAAALFIAILTVGSQTIRAALTNPAETLRYE